MFKHFFVNWLLPFICLWKCSWQRIYCFQVYNIVIQLFSSVQFSRVWLFATPWTAACQASLSITNSHSLLELMSIGSVIQSNYIILCCPLQGLFKWVSSSHQVAKDSPFIYTLIDHHNKSSNHLSQLSIAILLTVFAVHYIPVTFTL